MMQVQIKLLKQLNSWDRKLELQSVALIEIPEQMLPEEAIPDEVIDMAKLISNQLTEQLTEKLTKLATKVELEF